MRGVDSFVTPISAAEPGDAAGQLDGPADLSRRVDHRVRGDPAVARRLDAVWLAIEQPGAVVVDQGQVGARAVGVQGRGTPQAAEPLDRAQGRIGAQPGAQLDQALLRVVHVVEDVAVVAGDRADQHGVSVLGGAQVRGRGHTPGATDRGLADQPVDARELEAEAPAGHIKHAQRLGHDLGADAIAGEAHQLVCPHRHLRRLVAPGASMGRARGPRQRRLASCSGSLPPK